MAPFPVLRFTAGILSGATGLILVAVGALTVFIRGDVTAGLALITPGIAIVGPLSGFFIGEANGRRSNGGT